MPDRLALVANWSLGIVRDMPRHIIPVGGSYDLLDYLVEQNGKLYKRGGTSYKSAALPSQDDLIGIAAPEFPGDPRVVAFGSDSVNTTLFDITTDTPAAGVDCHAALLLENPPLYVDRLIICDGLGVHGPQKAYLDGGPGGTVVVADLTANPPLAKYSCLHAGRLVLANSTVNPNRVWFGPPLDIEPERFDISAANSASAGDGSFEVAGPVTTDIIVGAILSVDGSTGNDGDYTVTLVSFDGTTTTISVAEAVTDNTADGTIGMTWDIFEGYIDVTQEVTGLASIQGTLLVFSRGHYERILGDIPPGYGVETALVNMELQPAAAVGCIDARSLVSDGNVVFVANENGLYAVTGAGDQSLTTKPEGDGIAALWQATLRDFAPALGSVVACGILRDHLFVSVRRRFADSDPQRDQFLCYLPAQAWTRLGPDCGAHMYATRYAPSSALYSAVSSETDNRARELTGIFSPDASNKFEADGVTAVQPIWESATLGLVLGVQRRHYYDYGEKHYDLGNITYILTDADMDVPAIYVTQSSGLEATTAFLGLPESPLPATTTMNRKRVSYNRNTVGLTLRFTQDGPSAATELHMVELMVRSLDPGGGEEGP